MLAILLIVRLHACKTGQHDNIIDTVICQTWYVISNAKRDNLILQLYNTFDIDDRPNPACSIKVSHISLLLRQAGMQGILIPSTIDFDGQQVIRQFCFEHVYNFNLDVKDVLIVMIT